MGHIRHTEVPHGADGLEDHDGQGGHEPQAQQRHHRNGDRENQVKSVILTNI